MSTDIIMLWVIPVPRENPEKGIIHLQSLLPSSRPGGAAVKSPLRPAEGPQEDCNSYHIVK